MHLHHHHLHLVCCLERVDVKELTDTFRVAGLSHIVVLSGFNIAIIISFVILLLRVVPLFVRVLIASLSGCHVCGDGRRRW